MGCATHKTPRSHLPLELDLEAILREQGGTISLFLSESLMMGGQERRGEEKVPPSLQVLSLVSPNKQPRAGAGMCHALRLHSTAAN